MQDQNHAVENAREYQPKVDLCLAHMELVNNRIRTQEWYRELSEQGSDEEIDQMLGDEQPRSAQGRRSTQRVHMTTANIDQWLEQLREESSCRR